MITTHDKAPLEILYSYNFVLRLRYLKREIMNVVALYQNQQFQELRSKHKKIINKRVYPR